MTSLFYTQLNEEKYRTPNFGSRSVDVIRSNFIITDTTESKAVAYEELAFPWRVDSKSPIVSEILCSYRQYQLVGIPIGRIFQSRINDGFVLKRMKQLQGKSQTKLEIIFSLAFGPHIEILYTLKFSILAHQQPTRLHDFVPEKVIRVDINILAHHAFALLFINIHSYDIGNTQKGFNSIIYESLIQLNSLLKDVIECDEALSVLGQFNTQSALILSQQLGDSGTPLGRRNTSDLPTNYWHYVMEVIKLKPHLLDTFDMNLILRSASLEDDPGQAALEYFKRDDKNFNSRYQKATIYLSGFLKRWASFALSKTCYVRWVLRDGDYPTGCVFLTLFYETTNLMRIKLRFFSVELTEKREILKSFKEGLILKIESKSGEFIYPIYSCEKLCRNLLVSYSANEESRMTEWWKKQDPTPLFFIPHPRLSRSFLKQKSWIWLADFEVSDDLIWDNFFDDAFMALYNARIEEGMMRVFESPGTVTFYKEDNTLLPPYTISIQYVILWNVKGRFLSSQLWTEPYFRKSASAGNQEFNAYVAKEVQKDLRNLNRLVAVTFAGIRSLISLRSLEKFNETSIDPPEYVPTEFKLSSIFVGSNISLFPLPTFAQKIDIPSCRSNDRPELLELDARNKMLLDANLTLTYSPPSLSQGTELNICKECPELSKIGLLELGFYRNSLKQVFNESNQFVEVSMDATLASIMQSVIGESSGVYKKADIFFQNSASHILAIILPLVFINGACPLLLIESPKRPENASCVKFTELNAFSVELTLSRDNLWDQAIDADSSFVRHDVLATLRKEFLRSAFKSLYTALLANIEYPPECMQQVFKFLVPRRLNIGITDFVNIAKIFQSRNPTDMKILNLSKIQVDLANVIQSRFSAYGDETTLYYVQQTIRTIPINELFSLDLTNDPLFIRITVVTEDSKILSHYPSLLENITDAGKSLESFVPSLNSSVHVSIDHFVVNKKLSIRNAEIIERLNRDLTNILDTSIMKAMLHLNELEVNDMLADYWNDLLSSASKSAQPRFELDYMYNEFSDIGENDFFFTYTTNFIHQSCSELFDKAVLNVNLAGRSFCFNGNCFYICSRYCDFYAAPFWVSITVPNSQLLNLYLFTVELSMDDKLRLLSELHGVIKAAVWETNQRYLLRELAKTNMSLDADFLAGKAPKDSPILDDVLFHFGCPLKYEAFFNVHWRLTPTKVLNSVLSMFQPLLIHSRANYIVHSEKFYLRFQIVGADLGNESDYSSRGIKMQCFGVDDVGDEIKQSLVRVIKSKIDMLLQSEITLFLSRNVSVAKLSAQDIEFLIPPNEVPSSEVTYLLVKELENMHLFMLLLRQEFLLFLKPVLADAAGLVLLGNYYQKRYGVMHNVSEKTKFNVLMLGRVESNLASVI